LRSNLIDTKSNIFKKPHYTENRKMTFYCNIKLYYKVEN